MSSLTKLLRNGKFSKGQSSAFILMGIVVIVVLVLAIVPILTSMSTDITVDRAIAILNERGYVAYASPTGDLVVEGELTVTGDIIPGSDCGSSLGSASERFKDLWLCSPTIYLGEVTISNAGSQIDIDGQLVMHDGGKVWIELQQG